MMAEALTEPWQEFVDKTGAQAAESEQEIAMKQLVVIMNLLKMNLLVSKPLLEGGLKEVKLPTITNINDPVAKHLQFVRSLPPRCIISTMCGMKELANLNSNFEVIQTPPLTRKEFMLAMNL